MGEGGGGVGGGGDGVGGEGGGALGLEKTRSVTWLWGVDTLSCRRHRQ